MADFKLIMNGWKDICNRSAGCAVCPIKACDTCYSVLEDLDENAIASIESTVLAETPTWVPNGTGTRYACSVCGGKSGARRNYCPDFGRKMLLK